MEQYMSSDQAGFALTIDELRDKGEMLRLLPIGTNTVAWQVLRGEFTHEELRLLHAVAIYRLSADGPSPRRKRSRRLLGARSTR